MESQTYLRFSLSSNNWRKNIYNWSNVSPSTNEYGNYWLYDGILQVINNFVLNSINYLLSKIRVNNRINIFISIEQLQQWYFGNGLINRLML